jgi:hypothetical protein
MAVLANRKASESVDWLSRCSAHLVKLTPTITADEGNAIALCIWQNEHLQTLRPEAAVDRLLAVVDTRDAASFEQLVPCISKAAEAHRDRAPVS